MNYFNITLIFNQCVIDNTATDVDGHLLIHVVATALPWEIKGLTQKVGL